VISNARAGLLCAMDLPDGAMRDRIADAITRTARSSWLWRAESALPPAARHHAGRVDEALELIRRSLAQ